LGKVCPVTARRAQIRRACRAAYPTPVTSDTSAPKV
jgi:hypothetical protein